MLDRNLVYEQLETVRECLSDRQAAESMKQDLETVSSVISRRRQLQQETDGLRSDRKKRSKEIGALMKSGRRDEAQSMKENVRAIGHRLDILESERKGLENRERELLLSLPNVLAPSVPRGGTEADNELVDTWGEPRSFSFQPKEHHVLGAEMGHMDTERATKIAGARFSVLRRGFARLERALINFFLDQAGESGYEELLVPYIVNSDSMTGTGQLPKFEEDLFKLTSQVAGMDAYLIPTAEVPVTNLHRGEILNEEDLPLRYTAFTPCFRAEAGSYGKDTHGLIRQHQFHKVELVKITTPERSEEEHELLTQNARTLLEKLELPYRVMRLCSGDIGFCAMHCYDLEVWLPGQDSYREISSCSNFGDFQARRMMMRYRPAGGGKPRHCHTINGSALAIGRSLVAVVENHQQEDGSIAIPKALQPYMGGSTLLRGK
jgi:seryl-tRNA synthetase